MPEYERGFIAAMAIVIYCVTGCEHGLATWLSPYGIEPGIGQAIKDSGVPREDVFIVSKTGPGGLAWPLGYNETISQAEEIVANYSTTYVDLLLVHWPVNYGPCSFTSTFAVTSTLASVFSSSNT